jgi:hypothetical protein
VIRNQPGVRMPIGIIAKAASAQSLEAAHRKLLADPTLQFQFASPKPKPEPPAWLEALGQILQAIAPFMNYVFWAGVIVIAGFILYAIVQEIIRRLPGGGPSTEAPPIAAKPEFRPTKERAQALLEEADRLARAGRYSEAVRVLLHRSINDIEDSFPNAVMPSLTAREIGRLEQLSARGRDVFALIARAVERSLFGGRALGAEDFAACRHAYADFVFGAAPQ